MKVLRAAAAAIIGSALMLMPGLIAQAAEVKVLAVGAFPGAFKELVPQFERASGHKLTVNMERLPV